MSGPVSLRSRAAELAPWLAAGAGVALITAAFYPGYMSSDSIDQLMQGRSGSYFDWHPALMSWLWGRVDRLIPGPLGMLLLHNLLFWGALALLLRTWYRPATAAVLVLAVGLTPSCFGLLSTIWKDVGFAAALLLAFAILVRISRGASLAWLAPVALLLFYGCGVRRNGASAVVPLAIWAGLLAQTRIGRGPRWLAGGCGLLAACLLFWGSGAVNAQLTGHRPGYQSQQLFLHDLVAISLARNENVLPPYMQTGERSVTLEDMRGFYTPVDVSRMIWGEGRRLQLTADAGQYRELLRHWLRTVPANLPAYLRHRARVAAATFGVGGQVYAFHPGIDPNPLGLQVRPSTLNRLTMRLLHRLETTVFFRGWFFLVATAMALAAVRWRRSCATEPALALAASSLFYALPYLLISPAFDFRLIWWSVVAGILLPVLAAAPAAVAEQPAAAPPLPLA